MSHRAPLSRTLALLVMLALPAAAEDTRIVPPIGSGLVYSFAPLVEKTAPAVVNIYTRKSVRSWPVAQSLDGSAYWRLFRDALLFGYGRERIENSLGSGVIVAPEGVIVTNYHVVENAEDVAVALSDGRVFAAAAVLLDQRADIAVLRIDTGGARLPFLEFGDSDSLKVGDPVIAIGNPYGLGQTVTSGIVSALARTTFGIGDFRFFIQTDAAINPGNSGGAQIAMDGKLVGINTAIYSTTGASQGLGFAVPSNMVRMIVDSALHGHTLVRPWIGISGRRVPPRIAARLGLADAKGVLVTATYADGPAARAGLRPGDVIVAADGFAVEEYQALRYRVATRMTGENVRLAVVRGGVRLDITVPLAPPPDVPPRDETWPTALSPLRGARIASLSPALAEEIGLDSGRPGVVVLEVSPGSAAARLGLAAGDIVVGLDTRAVRTAAELLEFRRAPFTPWRLTIARQGEEVVLGGR